MKEEILNAIPTDEKELINAVRHSSTKKELFEVLAKSFGLDRSAWHDWQVEVERIYIANVDKNEF